MDKELSFSTKGVERGRRLHKSSSLKPHRHASMRGRGEGGKEGVKHHAVARAGGKPKKFFHE